MREQVGLSSSQGCTEEIPLRGTHPLLSSVPGRSQCISLGRNHLLQANLCQAALPCLDLAGR